MKWEQAVKDYQHYLKIERGLSDNSIKNYLFDLTKLTAFLEAQELSESPISIGKETVQQFIYQVAKTINPRSQARIISGLKSFFNYLVFEDYRQDNPMDLVESPKIGRKLPDTLSQKEIDLVIGAIDLSKPEGERNRAMLENPLRLRTSGIRIDQPKDFRSLFLKRILSRLQARAINNALCPSARSTKSTLRSIVPKFGCIRRCKRGLRISCSLIAAAGNLHVPWSLPLLSDWQKRLAYKKI